MAVAAYLRVALRPPVFWTSVDAGSGKLTPAAAGNAKGRGVKAGFPDLLVIVPYEPAQSSVVIAIELKVGRNGLSPVQQETIAALTKAGVQCHVARSVEEVEAILAGHGIPLRARSLPLRQSSGQALWKARAA